MGTLANLTSCATTTPGAWVYTYNLAGDLLTQRDAKNQTGLGSGLGSRGVKSAVDRFRGRGQVNLFDLFSGCPFLNLSQGVSISLESSLGHRQPRDERFDPRRRHDLHAVRLYRHESEEGRPHRHDAVPVQGLRDRA